MLKNYLKTALRNLARHKSNTLINIAGLTVSFAAFLIIFLIIQYEKSFDSFHKNKNSIYRIARVGRNPVNREYRTGVPVPVTAALRSDFPQLANAAAISGDYDVQVLIPAPDGTPTKKFKEPGGYFFAEPQFFRIFDFPLAEGDLNTALDAPDKALLTKTTATKYFGDWQNATGKTIRMDGRNIKVTGILNDPPANSDFPIKGVLSYKTMANYMDMSNWGNINDMNYCFVQLSDNNTPAQFTALLHGFVDKRIKPVNPGYTLELQPLNEIHYDERYGNFNGRTFSKDLILALTLIGCFLLIVACVNFINLSTALAVNRGREVGVRKVLGSSRSQLIKQFLGETGVTTLLAMLCSLIIVIACIPAVNNLMDIHLTRSTLYSGQLIACMLATLVIVTLLAGFYPALVISGFKPVTVLKSAFSPDNKKGVFLRRGLVVFQFVIAQTLIIGTLIIASQISYFRNADMGFKKEAIINADIPDDSLSHSKMDLLRNELLQVPGIQDISYSMGSPATGGGWWTDLRKTGNKKGQPDMIINMKLADTGFFRLYKLPLVAGRIYYPSDTMREFMVNETVIRNLGIRDPKTAIGMNINVNGKTLPIVGVVKDFHVNSLRDPIQPVVLSTIRNTYGVANIAIDLGRARTVIAAMEKAWNSNFPEYAFEYMFLDQAIANYYQQENQLSALYKIFSAIVIFISCLGLYGLVSFMAVQRKKEIGIRKLLGAPIRDILVILSREFTILITIAFFIAAPIAWYFMHQWLQQYSFRIPLGIGFFIATIAGSLCIAWLAVGYTTIRAAMANPINSLRSE